MRRAFNHRELVASLGRRPVIEWVYASVQIFWSLRLHFELRLKGACSLRERYEHVAIHPTGRGELFLSELLFAPNCIALTADDGRLGDLSLTLRFLRSERSTNRIVSRYVLYVGARMNSPRRNMSLISRRTANVSIRQT